MALADCTLLPACHPVLCYLDDGWHQWPTGGFRRVSVIQGASKEWISGLSREALSSPCFSRCGSRDPGVWLHCIRLFWLCRAIGPHRFKDSANNPAFWPRTSPPLCVVQHFPFADLLLKWIHGTGPFDSFVLSYFAAGLSAENGQTREPAESQGDKLLWKTPLAAGHAAQKSW